MLREAIASARSQPVFTFVTLAMVIGMVVAVMLTSGRAIGAEERVVDSIDATGTRMITVRANDNAGITADVLDRIAMLQSVEWSAAFTYAVDGRNIAIPGGTKVPVPMCSPHTSKRSACLLTRSSTERQRFCLWRRSSNSGFWMLRGG